MTISTIKFFKIVAEMLYVHGGSDELDTEDAIAYLERRLEEIWRTNGPNEPEQG